MSSALLTGGSVLSLLSPLSLFFPELAHAAKKSRRIRYLIAEVAMQGKISSHPANN
jgi:hypothetical protein